MSAVVKLERVIEKNKKSEIKMGRGLKNGYRKCIHSIALKNCEYCRINGLCIHGTLKWKCNICYKPKKCIHNVTKYSCKRCKMPALEPIPEVKNELP